MELQKVSKVLVPVVTTLVGGIYFLVNDKRIKKNIYPYKSSKNGFICAEGCRLQRKHEAPSIIIFAPAGGYKTSTMITPNIMDRNYKNGMVIFDVKNDDLFINLGPALKKEGWNVKKFSPNNPINSIHINLWDIFSYDYYRIVSILLTSSDLSWKSDTGLDAPGGNEWTQMAEPFLGALVYHVSTLTDNNLKGLKYLLNLKYNELDNILKNSESMEAREYYNRLINQMTSNDKEIENSKQLNSIRETVNTKLSKFFLPNILEITENSNFTIEELLNNKTVLFYCCDTGLKYKYGPFNLLVFHMIFENIKKFKNQYSKYEKEIFRIYLDEFENMGFIYGIESIIKTCRSINISLIITIQNYEGLENIYGKEAAYSLVESAGCKIALNGADTTVVKRIFGERAPKDKNGELLVVTDGHIEEGKCLVMPILKRYDIYNMTTPVFYKKGELCKRFTFNKNTNNTSQDVAIIEEDPIEKLINNMQNKVQKVEEENINLKEDVETIISKYQESNNKYEDITKENEELKEKMEQINGGISKKDKQLSNLSNIIKIQNDIDKSQTQLLILSERIGKNKYTNSDDRDNDIKNMKKYQKEIKKLKNKLTELQSSSK